ncbi:MAG TPA: hypothetical protein PLZ73_04940 [bacterium]|nr:hypothetical protein [bacterium]
MDMPREKRQCGGLEDYQWLIALIIEAVVRVITAIFDKDKPSKPDTGPAAETTTNNEKEQNNG